METLNEVNELLTTKMCSPVIIYGVILVLSVICIYFTRQRLGRYSTLKMENLYNLYSAQELKFLLVLGITMYGLCQYNKTELAWIFLIFPVIYIMLQNVLLYVHVASALQNAPADQPMISAGYGMQAPLLSGQGPTPPQISMPEVPPPTPTQPQQEFTLPKITPQGPGSLGGGFGSVGSGIEVSGYNI